MRKRTEKAYFARRRLQKTIRIERTKKLTGGSHLSGLKFKRGGSGLAGARGPRWSPAAIHGEVGRSEVTSVLRVPFRVGWWSRWLPGSTTSAVAPAPADGGSGVVGGRRRELH